MDKLAQLLDRGDDVHIARLPRPDDDPPVIQVSVSAGGGHAGQGTTLDEALTACLESVSLLPASDPDPEP